MSDKTFFSLFQTLFFLVAVPFGLILGFMLHLPWNQMVIIGIVAGISMGVPMAFLLQGIEMRFARQGDINADLSARLARQLETMGYERDGTFNRSTVFKPTYKAGILGDNMVLNEDEYEIALFGPKRHVVKLARQLGLRQ